MNQWYLDIETTTDFSMIRTIGLLGKNAHFYPSLGTDLNPSFADRMKEFIDRGDRFITWNGTRFDIPMINDFYGVEIPDEQCIDAMVIAKMLLPDLHSHSLKAVAKHFFPHSPDMWKDDIEDPDWYNTCSMSDLCKYLRQDLEVTKAVYNKLQELARKYGGTWKHPLRVEQEVIRIVERQKAVGVSFDVEKALETWYEIKERIASIEAELEPMLPILSIPETQWHKPPILQFKKDGTPSAHIMKYCDKYGWALEYNTDNETWMATKGLRYNYLPLVTPLVTEQRLTLDNSRQMKEWLLGKGWVPTMWNTKKDSDGKWVRTSPRITDKITKEPCPNIEKMGIVWIPKLSEWLMLRARKNVLLSDKGTGWIAHAKANKGIIPSEADTLGAATGRFTHRIIANVPRKSSAYGKEFRSFFRAREGRVWVGWDASSLEACMEAHYVYPYDFKYADALVSGSSEDGTDVHTRNMTLLALPNRDVAKTFKYAITYGAKPPKLAESLNVPLSTAQRWYDEFWITNDGLLRLKMDLVEEWKAHGKKYIVGLDGRLLSTRSEHSLLNTKLQGGGAILMKHSMLIANKTIQRAYPHAEGLIRYHDEEQWECLPGAAEAIGELGVQSIELAAKFLKLNVKVTGEYNIGNNWAETH